LQAVENDTTYGDWYLPSMEELLILYQNKAIIDLTAVANGGSPISAVNHWRSYEISQDQANFVNFFKGSYGWDTKNRCKRIRATRSF
jgi:hypothetical protein